MGETAEGEAAEASEGQGREEGSSWAEQGEEEEVIVEAVAARPKPAAKRKGKAKNKNSDAKASRLGKDKQSGRKQTVQTDSESGE